MRAPRPRPDHDEVLERTDLPTDVAALQGLRRQNEKPLLGGGSFWVGGQRCEVTLQRPPDRLVRSGLVALTQDRRGHLFVHALEHGCVRGLVRRGRHVRGGRGVGADGSREPASQGRLSRRERAGIDRDRPRRPDRSGSNIDERRLEPAGAAVLAIDTRQGVGRAERSAVFSGEASVRRRPEDKVSGLARGLGQRDQEDRPHIDRVVRREALHKARGELARPCPRPRCGPARAERDDGDDRTRDGHGLSASGCGSACVARPGSRVQCWSGPSSRGSLWIRRPSRRPGSPGARHRYDSMRSSSREAGRRS